MKVVVLMIVMWLLAVVGMEATEDGGIFTVCPFGVAGQNGCDFIGGDGIQAAVDAAFMGAVGEKTTVLLKSGKYFRRSFVEFSRIVGGSVEKQKCFVGIKGKQIIIEGESTSSLDGSASGDNMSGLCIEGGDVEIKNLVVSGFKESRKSDYSSGVYSLGCGVYADGDARLFISDSVIEDNQGCGVGLGGSVQAVLIRDAISGNGMDSGVGVSNFASVFIVDSTIGRNRAGGLVGVEHSRITLKDSLVRDNEGEGLFVAGSAWAAVSGSSFLENTREAISLVNQSQITVRNSVVQGNGGDGIFVSNGSSAVVTNNTVVGNKMGGIGCVLGSKCVTKNNIVVGNYRGIYGGDIQYNLSWNSRMAPYLPRLDFSVYDLGGTLTEIGLQSHNISLDPVFVNADGNDFRLKVGSPAIDAGDPTICDTDGSRSDLGFTGGGGRCSNLGDAGGGGQGGLVGVPNPASFFCVDMGYQNIEGMCVNGEEKCKEWSFFRGECRLNGKDENPRLYLERKSGATRIGETMVVAVGIDSRDKKIIGIDLVIKFGGPLRLERVEAVDESVVGFNYDRTGFLGKIDNEKGSYEAALAPASMEALAGEVAKGPLLNLVFKRERQGLGHVYFVCGKNSVRESNIISYNAEDVLSCGDNLNLIGMAGDADWSGKTDFSDLKLWKEGYLGGGEMRGDFNGNGRVEIGELLMWKKGYLLQLDNWE